MIDKEKVKELISSWHYNNGMFENMNLEEIDEYKAQAICDLEKPQEAIPCCTCGHSMTEHGYEQLKCRVSGCNCTKFEKPQESGLGWLYFKNDDGTIAHLPIDRPQEPQKVVCPECNGSGVKINQTKAEKYAYWYRPEFFNECCSTCHGTGKVSQSSPEGLLLTRNNGDEIERILLVAEYDGENILIDNLDELKKIFIRRINSELAKCQQYYETKDRNRVITITELNKHVQTQTSLIRADERAKTLKENEARIKELLGQIADADRETNAIRTDAMAKAFKEVLAVMSRIAEDKKDYDMKAVMLGFILEVEQQLKSGKSPEAKE
jgi:hypothetical protein